MAKKALCVGINDYPIPGADLNGCVNDAKDWARLLIDHYDFTTSDVTLLLDDQATKKGMVAGLEDLLAGARSGDVLVFTNSSHGSQIPDRSGDEDDSWDEILCPYDVRESPLVDDELRELFESLPRGVRLTMISDSCHSGSATRLLPIDELLTGIPEDRRPRYLSPALLRGTPAFEFAPRSGKRKEPRQSSMKHLLISGCLDREVSYDAQIGGSYHGAMTHSAVKAITEARFTITYKELIERTNALVAKGGFDQHPQLEGKSAAKRRQIFT